MLWTNGDVKAVHQFMPSSQHLVDHAIIHNTDDDNVLPPNTRIYRTRPSLGSRVTSPGAFHASSASPGDQPWIASPRAAATPGHHSNAQHGLNVYDFDILDPQLTTDDFMTLNEPVDMDDLGLLLPSTELNVTSTSTHSPQIDRSESSASEALAKTFPGFDWLAGDEAMELDWVQDANELDTITRTLQNTSSLPSTQNRLELLPTNLSPTNSWPGEPLLHFDQQSTPKRLTRATIRELFELRTCEILSIKDDQTRNPWRTLIWPLSQDSPALYHALAAMTCLQLTLTQPEFGVPGIRHYDLCMQALSTTEVNDSMSVDSAIATRLALAWAECWDTRKTSTGMNHINIAHRLLQKAVSNHQTSSLSSGELSRLSFLANTWIYMDVLARFSCFEDGGRLDFEFMNTCSLLSPVPLSHQVDPLMGCAVTLFPMIGRLADLVRHVRRRTEKRNSPAIISKALDIRSSIEHWIPPISTEPSKGHNHNISDPIQTAEAYRWAALLLLRQTVPELPSSYSMWDLAQKTLVFLATVPPVSGTTIIQTFPLLIAACEAYGNEDREWVLERWDLMAKRMIAGTIDRCRRMNLEVWRRRDEYENANFSSKDDNPNDDESPTPEATRHNTSSQNRATTEVDETTTTSAQSTSLPINVKPIPPPRKSPSAAASAASAAAAARSIGSKTPTDFPQSLAFKKDIDPITMAGSIQYTVKGSMHWLGVMRDWGWEGMYCLPECVAGSLLAVIIVVITHSRSSLLLSFREVKPPQKPSLGRVVMPCHAISVPIPVLIFCLWSSHARLITNPPTLNAIANAHATRFDATLRFLVRWDSSTIPRISPAPGRSAFTPRTARSIFMPLVTRHM